MSEGNLNITPEMISNLANMIKNNANSSNTSKSSSDSFKNSSQSSSQDSSQDFSSNSSQESFVNNIDFDTIFKIKSIIENLNKKDDPRSNLLYSLKPYLRKSRQKKIEQYVNLFKIADVSNLLKNEKGNEV